jgi:hypothetical protein
MFLILFALKLAGPLEEASWWAVTCPLWAPVVLGAVIFCLTIVALGVAVGFVALAAWVAEKRNR